jgi:arsenate reductase
LRSRGVEFDVVEYLTQPPDRKTLERLLKLLGGDPMALLRIQDPKYAAAGLNADEKLDAAGVVEILLAHPEVMQRPIVVRGERAVIARPAEKVLELLDT